MMVMVAVVVKCGGSGFHNDDEDTMKSLKPSRGSCELC